MTMRGGPRLAAFLAALTVLAAGVGLCGCGAVTPRATVTVLGTWTGEEQERFENVLAAFEERTGTRVEYEGTRDFEAVLAGRIDGGDPPDLALMPSLGDLEQYARDGELVALDGPSPSVDLGRVRREYQPTWLQAGVTAGPDGRARQYGLLVKGARKSLLWYSADAFSWPLPATLDELVATGETIAATGTPPWCLGLRSSSDSGWPGTDWVEDILLHQSGAEAYRAWAQGRLPWTSDTVRTAWTTWGRLLAPGMVRGDATGALLTRFGDAATPMFDERPGCYLNLSGSFASYQDSAGSPATAAHVEFPSAGGERRIIIAGDILAMFDHTSAAAELAEYLTGAEAQTAWARAGGTIAPNSAVTDYPDEATRQLVRSVQEADCAGVVFDASDTMPAPMRTAFYRAVLEFVANPAALGTILTGLDEIRKRSYPAAAEAGAATPGTAPSC
ncbi:carbohydrate ABC transporter substrate-binding protein [Frankia sp. CNm7]|uniref:Carbohydrate ABC transporter substrate-binding protein n=1 Tax=Frankia nepalensis TaxID=1836974 RepID=A0A937URX6_9ACTN|nr:ABC transporter substrate-binding protein [Frankia nepalensis]MBL7502234.1 carbohydrate ABC transporter substrate-binding protein [Frankia nepalensis]MBL7513034.1 carbohydrate ABC transporter substrate-binding protein [Frankia nepalensis]MBL7522107.1 carbohydrate ABC transporter substrate-binding protein [Frankia nepalensis]MBL7628261.1 carbohydrate ABC transporter substrate-binding protein [Frankia nepalensis]